MLLGFFNTRYTDVRASIPVQCPHQAIPQRRYCHSPKVFFEGALPACYPNHWVGNVAAMIVENCKNTMSSGLR